MKERYAQLHIDMLADINRCLLLDLPEKERVEKCFWITKNYSKRLKELIGHIDFRDEDEEIDFFRNVKPAFVCYLEYFHMIGEAISSVPDNQQAAIAFWKKEGNGIRRFRNEYEEFTGYYESGQHHLDTTYFLRENNEFAYRHDLHIYDTDVDWCTSHDRLVRNYLAYRMYSEYCRKKIFQLCS